LAAVVNTGFIYTSIDGGVSWTERITSGSRAWYSITSSSDGTKLSAVVNGGFIYSSTDSGATWTQQTNSGSRGWQQIASSIDNNKLIAIHKGELVYTSNATNLINSTTTICFLKSTTTICFFKSTQILTHDGYTYIENLKVNDNIVTGNNRTVAINHSSHFPSHFIKPISNSKWIFTN
jgi:hypothetical protein